MTTKTQEQERVIQALRGCRDMLREAAKQFRLLNDKGHAVMSDRHANHADEHVRGISHPEYVWIKRAH